MGGTTGRVRVTSNRIKPFRRGYVSTVQRDAATKDPAKQSYDSGIDFKQAIKVGRLAEQHGNERFLNPFMYTKARAWTWAWEQSHGQCDGCQQCGPAGVLSIVKDEPFLRWLRRFETRRHTQYQHERGKMLDGRPIVEGELDE